MSLEVIVLAAGKGSRMHSHLPKVLHKVGGKEILKHVVDNVSQLNPKNIHIVYGFGGDMVKNAMGDSFDFVEQKELLGTGHAVLQALPNCSEDSKILVLVSDIPLITSETLTRLVDSFNETGVAVLTSVVENPAGLGRIKRDADNNVCAIIEDKDCSSEEKKITEIKDLNPKYWKKEDLDFLAENYKNYSLDDLAKKLGRTKSSLKNIAQLKGIDRRKIFWTEERIEQLRHLYLDLDKSALECAKILGVAESTVIKQCGICGFKKAKHWTEEEDRFIIENDSKYTVEELAKMLKVSKTTLMGRRWTLGLTKWDRTKK